MKLFSLLSCVVGVTSQTFRDVSSGISAYLQNNKDIDYHTQWRPSQRSARNGVQYIFDLQFNTRDDGTFCSNGYTGNTCTERVCPYGLSSSSSAFLRSGDAIHTPKNVDVDSGVLYGDGSEWGGTHSYTECSSQGVCDRTTGQCACFAGYQGKGCRRTKCPNDCSGHGSCSSNVQINDQYIGHRAGDETAQSFSTQFWDYDKTMQCSCDRGYAGNDCSERICPHGDDVLTSCSDSNNPDEQVVVLSNIVTAQDTESPFLECGEEATDPTSFTALEQILPNDGVAGDLHVPGVFAPYFSLTFTDHFGGSYTTAPIQVQSKGVIAQACMDGSGGILSHASKSACLTADPTNTWSGFGGATAISADTQHASATALAVQRALEALPNHAIPSVQVSGVTTTSRNVVIGTDVLTDSTNTDYAKVQSVLDTHTCLGKDIELTVRFTDEANSGKQHQLQVNVPDEATDCKAGMAPRMPVSFFDILTTDTAAHFGASIVDDDSEISDGTHEENAECGNRGICDTNTGKCNCFSGHTGEACGMQSNFV